LCLLVLLRGLLSAVAHAPGTAGRRITALSQPRAHSCRVVMAVLTIVWRCGHRLLLTCAKLIRLLLLRLVQRCLLRLGLTFCNVRVVSRSGVRRRDASSRLLRHVRVG